MKIRRVVSVKIRKKSSTNYSQKLAENDIYFIGTCTRHFEEYCLYDLTGWKRGFAYSVAERHCESGSLKDTLEEFVRSLFKIPEDSSPLVKMVTTGNHSNKHHVTTTTEQNSGEWIICFMFSHPVNSIHIDYRRSRRKRWAYKVKSGGNPDTEITI